MNYADQISNEEVNELPLLKFEGNSKVISSKSDVRNAIEEMSNQPFVGFDTETKPNFVKGNINEVALIQLSSGNQAYLIRLKETGLTEDIIRFFESDIPKIGIALHDDIKGLQRIRSFVPNSFINANKITHEMGIINQGIRKLAGIILGGRVSKGQQLSNWEAPNLTAAQISYAATDAWVCWEMYKVLLKQGHIQSRNN